MFSSGISHMRLACLTALGLCLAVLHGIGARGQEPVLVRIGWQPTKIGRAHV